MFLQLFLQYLSSTCPVLVLGFLSFSTGKMYENPPTRGKILKELNGFIIFSLRCRALSYKLPRESATSTETSTGQVLDKHWTQTTPRQASGLLSARGPTRDSQRSQDQHGVTRRCLRNPLRLERPRGPWLNLSSALSSHTSGPAHHIKYAWLD